MLFLAPILLLLGLLHLAGLPAEPDSYKVRAWTQGLSVVFLVAPVAGAAAGWTIGRLRRAEITTSPTRRSRERVIADSVWPTIVLASGTLILLGVARAGMTLPPLAPLVAALSAVLGLVCLGVVAAWFLRAAIALPLVLAGGYLGMVFPMAMEPLWLRHLTGFWPDCCEVNTVPSWRAGIGTASLYLGLLGAVLLVVRFRRGPTRLLALVPALGGLTLGVLSVHTLGSDPVSTRGVARECSSPAPGVRLCLWPEHEAARPNAERVLAGAIPAWRRMGVAVPSRFTEGTTSGGAVPVWFPPAARPDNMRTTLALAVLPPTPPCATHEPYPGERARPVVTAWLAVAAGLPLDRIGDVGLGQPAPVRSLIALPAAAQRRWYQEVSRSLTSCNLTPPPVVPPPVVRG